jgi:hypothetical protein
MATYYVDSTSPDNGGDGTTQSVTGGDAHRAWKSITYGLATMAGGDVLYVKASGTYSVANTTETFPLTPKAGTSSLVPTRVIGYTSTVGDNGKPTVQLAASASTNVFTISNNYVWLENFAIDAASQSSTSYHGVQLTAAYPVIKNLDIIGYAGYGVYQTGTTSIALVIGVRCHSAKAASSGGFAFINAAAGGDRWTSFRFWFMVMSSSASSRTWTSILSVSSAPRPCGDGARRRASENSREDRCRIR